MSLVFYAGHGLEMNGVNYLVPVDAHLERDTDVRFETVTLDDVLASTVGAGLRVVILDACRNNPLARSMQRTGISRNVSRGSFGDLDESLLGDETLVAYAAAGGTTADDGEGRNSPYTSALLSYLEQPLEIGLLFREVRARVLEATEGRQRPHEYASLLEAHYLRGPSRPEAIAAEAGLPADVPVQQENLFWQSIMNSANAEDFEAYLARWPRGVYAPLATNRLAALRAAASAAPTVASVEAEAAGDPPSRPTTSRPSIPEDESQPAELAEILGRELSASRSDDNGWTDLHYAAALNLQVSARHLLQQGANANAKLKGDGSSLSNPLSRRLQRRLGTRFAKWTRDGETPLHVAATVDARDAAVVLLERGAYVNARTEFNWTPLHYAAWANARGVAEALVAAGADMNSKSREADSAGGLRGRTPLQVAVEAKSTGVAALLRARGRSR